MEEEKKPGRPKKSEKKKKKAHIFVNLTESQKEELVQLAEIRDSSLSHLCVEALEKVGYLSKKK